MLPAEIIDHSIRRLASEWGFVPCFAAELECYVVLPSITQEAMDAFWRPVSAWAAGLPVGLLRIEKERGHHQYELVFDKTEDPALLAESLRMLRQYTETHGERTGIQVQFDAKPHDDAPASGLHLHISLRDGNGDSVYLKSDEYISPALHHSLGGLCALTPFVMPILCPEPSGYTRFHDDSHMARTVSWGSNNRSCAIRIPYSPIMDDKRLEWRVPCADADPEKVLALMLLGIRAGMAERMEPPEQYYGIASRDERLEPLPLDPHAARLKMQGLPDGFAPLSAAMLEAWSHP